MWQCYRQIKSSHKNLSIVRYVSLTTFASGVCTFPYMLLRIEREIEREKKL